MIAGRLFRGECRLEGETDYWSCTKDRLSLLQLQLFKRVYLDTGI